jgi:hypothetical protein
VTVGGVEEHAGAAALVDWARDALSGDGWEVDLTSTGIVARRNGDSLEVERGEIEEFADVRDPLGFLFLVRVRLREIAGESQDSMTPRVR